MPNTSICTVIVSVPSKIFISISQYLSVFPRVVEMQVLNLDLKICFDAGVSD